jgi:hypothetical protein
MIIAQLQMGRKGPDKKNIRVSAVLGIIIPILFSGYLGYRIYINTGPYFMEADGGSDISIISLDQISKLLFSEYLPVVLILITALIAVTVWFTIILDFRKDRQKESRR